MSIAPKFNVTKFALLNSGKIILKTGINKRYIIGLDVFFSHDGLHYGKENRYGLTEVRTGDLSDEYVDKLKEDFVKKTSIIHQINLYKLSVKELQHIQIMTSQR